MRTLRLLPLLPLLATAAEHRRLFLDSLAVQEQAGLERVFHRPVKFAGNPVIRSDTQWERGSSGPYLYGTVLRENGKLRMWYHFVKNGYRNAYAESLDGVHWTKPSLGIVEFEGSRDNNLFSGVTQDPGDDPPRKERGQCHNPSVIARPGQPYAMFCYGADWDKVRAAFSEDGLRWRFTPESARQGLFPSSDVVNFFHDPYQDRFVATWKGSTRRGRSVGIAWSKDGSEWTKPVDRPIFAADDLDPTDTQFYGMPVFPYQGLYIGLPWVYHANVHYAPEMKMTREEAEAGSPRTVDVQLAWSHDLLHWTRPPRREPFLPNGPSGAFDSAMIYTARAPVEMDGKLLFYYGGFDNRHDARQFNGAIGLASMRLDGFCSMRAGRSGGWLVTRREALDRPAVRINAVTGPLGSVAAEILDVQGNAVPGFSRDECIPFSGDAVDRELRWKTGTWPADRVGKLHQIRFLLREADLFSYWPD